VSDAEDQLARLRERVERLEAQVAFLQRGLGVTDQPAPEWGISTEVAELISRGERKEAVRLVREETGASLKDAMHIVDGYRGDALPG
jgi:ribosomal protein L7/L12